LDLFKAVLSLFYPSGQNRQNQSEGVRFCKLGTQNTMPYCQKYTPTCCFFGDFAHYCY